MRMPISLDRLVLCKQELLQRGRCNPARIVGRLVCPSKVKGLHMFLPTIQKLTLVILKVPKACRRPGTKIFIANSPQIQMRFSSLSSNL